MKSYNNSVLANAAYRELMGVNISIEESLGMTNGARMLEIQDTVKDIKVERDAHIRKNGMTRRMIDTSAFVGSLNKQILGLIDEFKRLNVWGFRK